MLFLKKTGTTGALIVMLHWLGGNSRSWDEVSKGLEQRGFSCAAIDLPGFGCESNVVSPSIHEAVQQIIETIRELREDRNGEPWLLAGHSMGGKFAMIIARMSLDGTAGLENLVGLVLVSPSPPGPEPMSEEKRKNLAESLGHQDVDDDRREKSAEQFIDDNTGKLPLLVNAKRRAVEDVLRVSPSAMLMWLTDGSREDCSRAVGSLSTSTIVFAGSEDKALGAEAQKEHTLPHLAHATLKILEGGGHLAPLERPAELVDRIAEFAQEINLRGTPRVAVLGSDMTRLIASDQTSPQTRKVLLDRIPDPEAAIVFSADELRTLRALVNRVVPDAGFDLALRIDQALAQNQPDGWRFDHLPPDSQAWKRGMRSLDTAAMRQFNVPFVALDSVRQDEMLLRAQSGHLSKGLLGAMHIGDSENAFDGNQMRNWFEDVRGELTKLYVSDPRTMGRMGFTGFADEFGFTQIKLQEDSETLS